MFYHFIYLAKGFRMRPKVRSTLIPDVLNWLRDVQIWWRHMSLNVDCWWRRASARPKIPENDTINQTGYGLSYGQKGICCYPALMFKSEIGSSFTENEISQNFMKSPYKIKRTFSLICCIIILWSRGLNDIVLNKKLKNRTWFLLYPIYYL